MRKQLLLSLSLLLPMVASAEKLPADPTRPSSAVLSMIPAEKEAVQYVLSALRTGSGYTVAVVNGQRVKAGDRVDGAKVLSVTSRGVSLSVGTEQKFLSLSERNGFSKVKSGK